MGFGEISREIRGFSTELKWSALFMLGMIVWSIGERLMGFHQEHLDRLAESRHVLMILLAFCHLACLHQKRKNYYGNQMRYWDGLVSCFALTVLVLVAVLPANYIIHTVISPDLQFNRTQYEIAHSHFAYHEVLQRNTLASYNVECLTQFILYGLGLSLSLPLFTSKRLAERAASLSNPLS